jgi:N,N'-diacetyllegionaminate synthase
MAHKRNHLFGINLVNGSSGPACVIAEAGINHDGKFEKARKLIDAAKKANATCVKFQSFNTKRHMSKHSITASYIEKGSKKGESFYELAQRLELTYDEQRELHRYAYGIGIPWISSVFDGESLEFLLELKVPVLKVASGELTNFPLLKKVAKTRLPLIVSTGMASLSEIAEVMAHLKAHRAKEIYLMHCVSWYPSKIDDMNIKVMDTLLNKFKVPVGFSDHTLGISVALGARARGIKFFEKHFALSKKDFGPDHAASLEPQELQQFVAGIDEVGRSLGDGRKTVTAVEMQQRKVHRKSIVASRDIPAGTAIRADMVEVKRPGFGIQPKDFDRVLGRRARKDIKEDEVIHWEMISK